MVSALFGLLGLIDQLDKGEHFGFWRSFESLLPLIGLQLFSEEIFYQKMAEPAIENLKTRQTFVFMPAV
jgi:hypothetical protein